MAGLSAPTSGYITNSTQANRIGRSMTPDKLQFPLSDFPQYYTRIEVADYSRGGLVDLGSLTKLQTTTASDVIKIPLPFSIVDAENVAYEEVSIGTIAGSTLQGLSGDSADGSGFVGSLIDGTVSALAKNAATLLKGSDRFNLASQAVDTLYQLNRAYYPEMAAVNPYSVVLLQGPRYKQHMLSWKFAPNNAIETQKIKSIIKVLKTAQRPELRDAYFGFPKILRIKMISNGNMMMFKPCVIETVSVNYTPSSTPALHYDGSAATYEIRLSLKELEYWFSKDAVFDDMAGGNR